MATQNSASLPANFGNSGYGDSPTGPAGSGKVAADKITEFTLNAGVTFDKVCTFSAAPVFSAGIGATTFNSTLTVTGALTPTGGVAAAGGFSGTTVCHSGGVAAIVAATGTDKTAVNTETYIVEVFVPCNMTITGVALLHLATSTGNVQVSLADSTGAPIAAAQSASTATVAAAAFQQVPFATPYAAKGPAKYYVLLQNSGSNHFRAHNIGNFGANKKTGETYGTFTSVTPPTTFTADLGPVCDLYCAT